MCYVYLLLNLLALNVCNCLDHLTGWNYINLHCRDNDNTPVDWWYIYKPANDGYYFIDRGRNFSYITPNTAGRWQASDKYITSGSMLQHTLSPLFRPTYVDYLAVIVYDERKPAVMDRGSAVLGIMMVDETGGFWIGHTVPGLPDMTQDRPIFPEEEYKNGHIMMCFSLDIVTLNEIARLIEKATPNIKVVKIPHILKYKLPYWHRFEKPMSEDLRRSNRSKEKVLEFLTRAKSLRVTMLAKQPGITENLYKTFAKSKKIVLDVYGDQTQNKPLCQRSYGVRSIQSISLKYPTEVYYQSNKTDMIGFAVSTAAHWQRVGQSERQYWVCTSSLATVRSAGSGGLLTCVEDFNVWATFDNLKIKEPEC